MVDQEAMEEDHSLTAIKRFVVHLLFSKRRKAPTDSNKIIMQESSADEHREKRTTMASAQQQQPEASRSVIKSMKEEKEASCVSSAISEQAHESRLEISPISASESGPSSSTNKTAQESTVALTSITAERNFSRSEPNPSSLGSRLSQRIRRSLRLGKKETSVQILSDEELAAATEGILSETPEGTFTNFSDIRITRYTETYGSLNALRQILRRNRLDDTKKFLRHNDWPVGHEIRLNLWQEICQKDNLNFSGLKKSYDDEAKSWKNFEGNLTPQVSFLRTADTIRNNYNLNDVGDAALHRLIRVLDSTQPNLTYAPLLRPLLAVFLHYMNEDDAYACAVRLLKNHSSFMYDSAIARKASSHTLLALIKKKKISVYKSLRTWIGTSDDRILAESLKDWPNWIFDALPFDYLIRVIDCYIFEGNKFLLRVAFALVYKWHKYSSKPDDFGKESSSERAKVVAKNIAYIASHPMISVQTLLDAATGIRNLTHSLISVYQKKYEAMVKATEPPEEPSVDRPAVHTRPFVSSIVNPQLACLLLCEMPPQLQLETPHRVYHYTEAGNSFTKLWSCIDHCDQTLIIIKASTGEIFGAFCDKPWSERSNVWERTKRHYFGDRHSFVWKINEKTQKPEVFRWVGIGQKSSHNIPDLFMAAPFEPKPTVLLIGGSAIQLRDDIIEGVSEESDTFNNPQLVEGGRFIIEDMEVFELFLFLDPDERSRLEEIRNGATSEVAMHSLLSDVTS